MFLLYFFIALVNAVLTFKIRKEEKKARHKEEKEHTIKLYNTLLNSLSHELRTPISTIIGAVDTLKDQKEKISSNNQIELLNQIDTASMRLNRQVENLLNMSRLEWGMLKLNLSWCDTKLLARIRSAMRRNSVANTNKINCSDLEIDIAARVVTKEKEILKLTATEFNLLALFAKNEGRVLTHQYILKEIWGIGAQSETQYLRVFVGTLRKKIENNPNQPKHIVTESGVGYRFA